MGWGAARAPVVKARKTVEGRTENFIVLSVSSKRFSACCELGDKSPRKDLDAVILIPVVDGITIISTRAVDEGSSL